MFDLKYIFEIAVKNLSRRKRRTLLLILGLAISNAVIIWIPTFRINANRSMMQNILEMNTGHEVISREGHFDFDKNLLDTYKTIDKNLYTHDGPYTLRAHAPAMASGEEAAAPILLKGMDIAREKRWNKLGNIISKSTFPSPFPLLIGKKLAANLNVKVGDELAIIGQAIDGSVANELFRVEELLDLGGGALEGSLTLTTLEALQNFLLLPPDQVHMVVNFSSTQLPLSPGLTRTPWEKFLPDVASGTNFMDTFIKFYVIFFIFVTSVAMANTLSLTFLERIGEYRMLNIIGAPSGWLKRAILTEIGITALGAMILGNLILLSVLFVLHFNPLDITILTGGVPLQVGGVMLSQKIHVKPLLEVFLWCDSLFLVALALAALYPIKVVLQKSRV